MKKHIKFVKRANQFCVTYFENDKQIQKWFSEEQEAKEFINNPSGGEENEI